MTARATTLASIIAKELTCVTEHILKRGMPEKFNCVYISQLPIDVRLFPVDPVMTA
jgi:hypothetical protein